jgi:hypothetical protein
MDPDTCACDVSKAEVADLKERLAKVEKLLSGSDIGSLESTVNDVLNGVTTMQQCISKMVLPGTEVTKAPVDTTKYSYDTTKMAYDTTKMAYETTKKDYYETTKMDYPETTKMEYPETTKMTYETTMKAVETTMMKYDTTMMDTTKMATTMMDTTMMETTAEPIVPTEAFEMYGFLDTNPDHGNKCQHGSARAFKIGFTSLEGCVKRCYDDQYCKYATTEKNSYCIGCKVVPADNSAGWYSYQTYQRRRQLTQAEALKIENAALRARLDELLRN